MQRLSSSLAVFAVCLLASQAGSGATVVTFEGTGATAAAITPARDLPHIRPWLDRMLARPAVQRAFATEKLTAPWV